ncbi:uncharacterized protein LOC129872439 [Solanum dulcamara]|uniref:uncharacterized protein LOC129872439 n=1 Tax=Solanum dulcamara TaxID=45834 RepID=UPI0024851E77|nr:uncharacterized protein LOC129872439 [Solanum dulcamara]
MVYQAMEKIKIIEERFQTTQSCKKSYTNVRRRDLEFELHNWIYLKVSPMKAFIHPVFHISMLKKCLEDLSLIIPTESIKVKESLSYEEILVQILDQQVHKLRTKEVASVKVLWRNHFVKEATWEAEEDIKARYPYLFVPPNDDVDGNVPSLSLI